jgi:hypothetical protein
MSGQSTPTYVGPVGIIRPTNWNISQPKYANTRVCVYIYTKKQHILNHGKQEQSKPIIILNKYRKFIITNLTPHSITDYQAPMLQKIQQSTQVGNHNIADKRTSLPSTPHKLGVGSFTLPSNQEPRKQ